MGDLVDKKNARRYDDCLSYTMVASKKVGKLPRESGCARQGPLLRTSPPAAGTSASCDTSRAGNVFSSEPHCASSSPGLRLMLSLLVSGFRLAALGKDAAPPGAAAAAQR